MSTKKPETGLVSSFSQAQDRENRADRMDMMEANPEASEPSTKATSSNQWDEKLVAAARQAIDEQMGLRR